MVQTTRRHFVEGTASLAALLGLGRVHKVTAQEATAAASGLEDYVWTPPQWEPEPPLFKILGRTDDTVTVETADGQFEVPANPQRIVCLDEEYTVLIPLGITEGYAGVTVSVETGLPSSSGDLTEEIRSVLAGVPGITTSWEVDVEHVISLEPDLVFGLQGYQDDSVYEAISQVVPFIRESPANYWIPRQALRTYGALFQREEKAEELIAEHEAYIARAKEKIAPYVAGKRVAVVMEVGEGVFVYPSYFFWRDSTNPDAAPIPIPTTNVGLPFYRELDLLPSNYVEKLADETGRTSFWLQISMENIGVMDADYIFLTYMGPAGDVSQMAEALDRFASHPIIQSTEAGKNGAVLPYNFLEYGIGVAGVRGQVAWLVEQITGEPFE